MVDSNDIRIVVGVLALGFLGCGQSDGARLADSEGSSARMALSARGVRLDLALDNGLEVHCCADSMTGGVGEGSIHLLGQTLLEVDRLFQLRARCEELEVDLDAQTLTLSGGVTATFDAPKGAWEVE